MFGAEACVVVATYNVPIFVGSDNYSCERMILVKCTFAIHLFSHFISVLSSLWPRAPIIPYIAANGRVSCHLVNRAAAAGP
jgi:hypothetical protein